MKRRRVAPCIDGSFGVTMAVGSRRSGGRPCGPRSSVPGERSRLGHATHPASGEPNRGLHTRQPVRMRGQQIQPVGRTPGDESANSAPRQRGCLDGLHPVNVAPRSTSATRSYEEFGGGSCFIPTDGRSFEANATNGVREVEPPHRGIRSARWRGRKQPCDRARCWQLACVPRASGCTFLRAVKHSLS